MYSFLKSLSALRLALTFSFGALALGVWQFRPLVQLGYVVASLPAPRGKLAVADREVALPLARADGQGTITVPVHIWYPAISLSKDAAPVASYPLILYAPVWGDSRLDNTALLASLASHGFVVAALDDIYRDPIALDATPADTEVRRTLVDFSGPDGRARMLAAFDRRLALQATKVSRVLDALIANRAQLPEAPFNSARIGMLGASFGGASAVEAGLTDDRISAVVNFDGWLRGKALAKTLEIPLANYNSTRGVPDQAKLEAPDANPNQAFVADRNRETSAFVERQLAARADTRDIAIAGASHGDYNNELYDQQRWRQWRPWRRTMIAPARMHEILDAHLAAFFGTHLARLGASDPAPTAFPEVAIRLGRRGPPG